MYIIDFERINELTAHPKDNALGTYINTSVFSITKNLIKEYISVYEGRYSRRSDDDKVKESIAILKYNKILIDYSDIRDKKIEKILESDKQTTLF